MKRVFRSQAAGDVIVMSPTGEQLLQIIGKDAEAQGIVTLAQLPAALQALEQAVAAEDGAHREAEHDDDAGERRIGLRQRAWPLVEMMKRSLAERADVVWGV